MGKFPSSSLTVFIDFFNQFFKDFLIKRLTHQTQDVGHQFSGNAAALLAIEAVESLLQNYTKGKQLLFFCFTPQNSLSSNLPAICSGVRSSSCFKLENSKNMFFIYTCFHFVYLLHYSQLWNSFWGLDVRFTGNQTDNKLSIRYVLNGLSLGSDWCWLSATILPKFLASDVDENDNKANRRRRTHLLLYYIWMLVSI